MRSFGLDLAGYTTNGSALAATDSSDEKNAVAILDGHCFNRTFRGIDSLAGTTILEVECLRKMLDQGKLFVDVPIDLQNLVRPDCNEHVWQLTKRPVDRAFNALCPLADRIGSCVARMANLWRLLGADTDRDPLGRLLFETYPAASLRLSGRCCTGYKGCADRDATQWIGTPAKTAADQKKNDALAALLNELKWSAAEGFRVTNDEFDAVLCALTEHGDQLFGTKLRDEINRLLAGAHSCPRGYVLLKSVPLGVHISRSRFESWIRNV